MRLPISPNSSQYLLSSWFWPFLVWSGISLWFFFFFLMRASGNYSFVFIYLFIYYLWLCRVFVSVRGLSPVAASGGHSSSRCAGPSLSWPLLLRSIGSRRAGSVIVAHGPSCSAAYGIFPDQGSNPCPLHWQADSQPLRHQGSPHCGFDLHFPGDEWCWASFCVLISRLHIFFGEISIQIFCPFLNRVICFYVYCWFLSFKKYILGTGLFSYVIFKYFLFCGLSFHYLDSVLWSIKVLNLI